MLVALFKRHHSKHAVPSANAAHTHENTTNTGVPPHPRRRLRTANTANATAHPRWCSDHAPCHAKWSSAMVPNLQRQNTPAIAAATQ